MILREQIRDQTSLAALGRRISKTHTKWQTEKVWIEDEKLGHALVTELRKETPPVPVEAIRTHGKSKEGRAVPLANKMERGEVFLPGHDDSWRPGFERELLAWYFWHWAHNPDAVGQADFEVYVRQLQKPGALRGGFMHFANVFEDMDWFKARGGVERVWPIKLGRRRGGLRYRTHLRARRWCAVSCAPSASTRTR
ncbi:MAG: hypothetical protein HC774_06515 [Sphingomonadales bacterium]|nr:hypothetical protein [Sphingomonadales bacterium]